MNIEVRQHRPKAPNGLLYSPQFAAFVDGELRQDIGCEQCRHYRKYEDCAKAVEVGPEGDDKLYPFCGNICGHFEMKDGETDA